MFSKAISHKSEKNDLNNCLDGQYYDLKDGI